MSTPFPSTALSKLQQEFYGENGYLCPVRVFEEQETARLLAAYMGYCKENRARLEKMSPRERYQVFSETHFILPWVYEIITHPRVLDAVESILGPNFIAWNTNWFTKMVGDKTFISWHQDGSYWKLSPPKVVTAWIALTPSQPITGCLKVVPGTHRTPAIPQRETSDQNNALSRGQEIAVDVDEEDAVNLALMPGEMSLHNIWIVHGSNPNQSKDTNRIGIAVRYVSTEVLQESPQKPLGILVRGEDTFGHFELLPAPEKYDNEISSVKHAEIIQRIRSSILKDAEGAPRK